MEKVNVCGVPESEFDQDGWCRKCNCNCEMTSDLMVDKKIFDFARRKGIIKSGRIGSVDSMFSKNLFEAFFCRDKEYEKAPQYVKRYLDMIRESNDV